MCNGEKWQKIKKDGDKFVYKGGLVGRNPQEEQDKIFQTLLQHLSYNNTDNVK